MGFNSVYRVLQNLFPQVDTRLLRAVAIENSKDADAAVEVVLVEIIPYLSKGTTASNDLAVEDACPGPAKDTLRVDSPYSDKTSNGSSDSKTSGDHDQVYRDDEIEEPASVGKPEKSSVEVGPDVTSVVMPIITVYGNGAEDHCNGVNTKSHEINSLEESSSVKVGSDRGSHSNTISGHDQVYRDDGNEESGSVGKHEKSNVDGGADVTSLVPSLATVFTNGADDPCSHLNTESQEINSLQESSNVKVGSDQSSQVSSTTSKRRCGCTNGITSRNQVTDSEDFDWPSACGCDLVVLGESHQEQSPVDVEISVVQWTPSPVQDCIPDAPEGSLQLAVLQLSNGDYETPESSGASDDASKNDVSSGEMVDFVDESALNAAVTRSGQICRIDLLEDIIEDARNNKKTLFSAMESIISLMREVELQEKAAELAKEEAVIGGLDMHSRVEDLKQMLQHAKEANSMHAGEVYGEKAILSTEVKELQSRLLSLSDERDKSLAILDEMRQTIEERLVAAEKTRKAAEQEKMEKEESARTALAEQELIMEKVVQESKMLKQEAEENSKLQEFLMDRGRVVDMLQGEISVICQDVKLLKEKFDERVPLSKSLSSSQTSCILASSSSSLKSMLPDQVPEQVESSETPKKSSPSASVDEQLSSGGEETEAGDRKELVDDGWELFENREFDL